MLTSVLESIAHTNTNVSNVNSLKEEGYDGIVTCLKEGDKMLKSYRIFNEYFVLHRMALVCR